MYTVMPEVTAVQYKYAFWTVELACVNFDLRDSSLPSEGTLGNPGTKGQTFLTSSLYNSAKQFAIIYFLEF